MTSEPGREGAGRRAPAGGQESARQHSFTPRSSLASPSLLPLPLLPDTRSRHISEILAKWEAKEEGKGGRRSVLSSRSPPTVTPASWPAHPVPQGFSTSATGIPALQGDAMSPRAHPRHKTSSPPKVFGSR